MFIWSDITVREDTRRLHTSERAKFKIQKIKYLFIIIKVQLITISSVIPYISETNSTRSSLKKKTLKRERGKEKEMEKRRRRKKRERKREGKRGRERRKERKKGE